MSEEIDQLKEAEKEKSEVYEEEHAPSDRRNNNWGAGIALIIIGAIFLVANVSDFHLNNWWALFILIPAVANFNEAWRNYQRHGRLTRASRNPLLWGVVITIIAFTFLLDLDWSLIWPIFLIIGGVGALLGAWGD